MRKLKKIILFLIGLFPLIMSAQTKEEIKWKWYTNLEENVHYEKDVENNCEYFEEIDKEKFMYGEWQYSFNKPNENENREIEKVSTNMVFNKAIANIIKITEFKMDNRPLKLKEIEIIDENNNNVDFEAKSEFISEEELSKLKNKKYDESIDIIPYYGINLYLSKTINIKDVKIKLTYSAENDDFKGISYSIYLHDEIRTNSYSHYSTDIKKSCESENCSIEIKVRENNMNNDDMFIRTDIYKYRDKYYKCYTKRKLYVPGYFEALDGFIKDEENYKTVVQETIKQEIIKNEPIEIPNENVKKEILLNKADTNLFSSSITPVNKELEEEKDIISENDETKDKIAMITKEKKEESNNILYFDLALIILLLLPILLIIIKKVKNSRTKY